MRPFCLHECLKWRTVAVFLSEKLGKLRENIKKKTEERGKRKREGRKGEGREELLNC